jgi:hypothetical protein
VSWQLPEKGTLGSCGKYGTGMAKDKSAQSLQVDLRRQGTPEPSEGALEVKRGSRQLPKVSFND